MSRLLQCPCSSELRFGPMDVHKAPCRLHHLLRPRLLFPASPTFLSPYICWHIPPQKAFRFTLCAGNHKPVSSRRSPVMSTRKGNSIAPSEGLCEVVWTVEADLADGQLLFIAGEPAVLGCWKPEMAILMSPTEHSKLWKAAIKVACGINCKYNYFIKEGTWSSSDVVWRSGPTFSLSVPNASKQDKKIVVRDSWMTCNMDRSPPHILGSWKEDSFFPIQPLAPAPGGDEDELVKLFSNGLKKKNKTSENEDTDHAAPKDDITSYIINNFLDSKFFPSDHVIKEKYLDNEDTNNATHRASSSDVILSERDQPIEEPWFSPYRLVTVCSNRIESDMSKVSGSEVQYDLHNIHHYQGTEEQPEEGNNPSLKHDSVSTIILINSSIHTMQRIAILEDEKLVELLLEPVESDVQSGSVYLGVVTKRVPKLGGAFVNIGVNKFSLMSINSNREPFIFPPSCTMKNKKSLNGSVIGLLKEHLTSTENEVMLEDDVEVIEDHPEVDSREYPEQMVDADYEELEVENDFDDPEDREESVNADIISYADMEADFEDGLDGVEHHLGGEYVKVPIVTEHSNESLVSFLQNPSNFKHLCAKENKWDQVQRGTKILVQVVKEGLGTKGPTVTPYPTLKSRFWVLLSRCDRIGVSKKIIGSERTRLKSLAKSLQPPGFGLTVRSFAAGRSTEELQKDLQALLSTWENIIQEAESSALAADEGVDGVILHKAMGQTLAIVQNYFNEQVKRMVVDSPRTYQEVTNYLQEIAPDLCDRVELHEKRIPIFDEFNIEEEINNILCKRVRLPKGGSIVIEQTEAFVSVDVNGGHGMLSNGNSQENANLEVNLAAAKQIAREIRLRGIGGIIVVDFIDMEDELNKRLVYEEVKKAVERDRSPVNICELSKHGLMEITRGRVRPSVTHMISEACPCCDGTGRVASLETSFSKIELEIHRFLAKMETNIDPQNHKTWPRFNLWVDSEMCTYLTSGGRTRLALLHSSLKVWIHLMIGKGLTRGAFKLEPVTDENVHKNQPSKKANVNKNQPSKKVNVNKNQPFKKVNVNKNEPSKQVNVNKNEPSKQVNVINNQPPKNQLQRKALKK